MTRIIMIAATLALRTALAADNVSYLSALPDSDELQFRFLIYGCLPGDRAALEFTFTRSNNPTVEISNLEGVFPANAPVNWTRPTNYADLFITLTNRVPRGRLFLRDSDVPALDRLLDQYRRREPRRWTGHTFIMVSQRRQGRTIATESFYTGGEGMTPDETDGAFDFYRILSRLERRYRGAR